LVQAFFLVAADGLAACIPTTLLGEKMQQEMQMSMCAENTRLRKVPGVRATALFTELAQPSQCINTFKTTVLTSTVCRTHTQTLYQGSL
jgi:hypothetical protein